MALFSSGMADLPGEEIAGAGVVLRHPRPEDYDDWARLRAGSRGFLIPWEPEWARDELTRSAFKRRLRRYGEDRLAGRGYAFMVFRQDGGTLSDGRLGDGRLVGGCNLSNLHRGVSQCASLGYWVGQPYQRQGLISAAVQAICDFAFKELRLHRIEAACIPANMPSRQLLKGNGFAEEGLARRYLKINGQWQDHVTFARLADDLAAAEQAAED